MTGFLVVNAYLKGEKFETLHSHLIKTAKDKNIDLEIRTNEEMIFEENRPDFVLFWDKDVSLARQLEKRGIPVFNSARAIELCDDKGKTYTELFGVVKQSETIIAPLSFFETDYSAFVKKAVQKLGLPLVFKERFGSFGEQVFLCNSEKEVLEKITGKPFLLQKFVETSKGRDVRVEVVGGKVVTAMKRINDSDFRSNITNGAIAVKCEISEAEKETAIKACEALGLDFGGVDILSNGAVCEVNSNAHIINIMNVTGVDIAPLIFDYILKKI